MEFALVKNGAVEIAAAELATLSKYLINTTGDNISLPHSPDTVVDLGNGYTLHPVAFVNDEMPPGKTPAGLFDYVLGVAGTVVERRVTLRDMTPQEIARNIRLQDRYDTREGMKASPFLAGFADMTPQQVRGYVMTHTNNEAGVRDTMADLALLVLSLAKGEAE